MNFNIEIKNLNKTYLNKKIFLILEGVFESIVNKNEELYFGSQGKSLFKSEIEFITPNRRKFKVAFEVTKDTDLSSINYIYYQKEDDFLTGKIDLRAYNIKLDEYEKQEIVINKKSPSNIKLINKIEDNKYKACIKLSEGEAGKIYLDINAFFITEKNSLIDFIEISISDNQQLIPKKIIKINQENNVKYEISAKCTMESFNLLSKYLKLRIYTKNLVSEYLVNTEFATTKISNGPYIKNIIEKKSQFRNEIRENIILLIELNDQEQIEKDLLAKLNSIQLYFREIYIISSKSCFAKLIKNKNYKHLDTSNNILRNLEIILKEYDSKNILYTNSKIEINEKLIDSFKQYKTNKNCVYIPKLITNNEKIVAAGNIIINHKLVLDFGEGENEKVSIFNFEKKLSACSNKAFYFDRETLKNAYHYKEDTFKYMKLFELFNFLNKYDKIELIYQPKLELISDKNNNPFYNSDLYLNSSDSLLNSPDKRKKIIIFADNNRHPFLKNYLDNLIDKNYVITLITNKIDNHTVKYLNKIIDKIEIIDSLQENEIISLFTKRKALYSNVWILDNNIFKLLKENLSNINVIYTPSLEKIRVNEYIDKNNILYSGFSNEDLNKEILTDENNNIYHVRQFGMLNQVAILFDTLDVAIYLNEHKVNCEILNKKNLSNALSVSNLEQKNNFKQSFKPKIELSPEKIDIIIPILNSEESIEYCINSVFNYCKSNFDLYLIYDSFKNDKIKTVTRNTKKRIGEKYNCKIFIIEAKQEIGYTNYINFCLNFCKNQFLILNSDCVLTKTCINKLFKSNFTYYFVKGQSTKANDSLSWPTMDINNEFKMKINNYKNLIFKNSEITKFSPYEQINIFNETGFYMGISKNIIDKLVNCN